MFASRRMGIWVTLFIGAAAFAATIAWFYFTNNFDKEIPSVVLADAPDSSVTYDPFKDLPPLIEAWQQAGLILYLKTSRTVVPQGQILKFTETIQNKSGKIIYANFRSEWRDTFEMAHYSNSKRWFSTGEEDELGQEPYLIYQLEVIGMVTGEGFPQSSFSSQHYSRAIKPDEQIVNEYQFRVMEPGIYKFGTRLHSGYSADHVDELWTGELQSNEIYIHVVPNTLLPNLGKGLVLTIEPEKKDYPFGTKMRLKGTLKNCGTEKVTINKNQINLKICGFIYNGQEECFRVRYDDRIAEEGVIELRPDESVCSEMVELVPSSYAGSTIKVKATARVQIFSEGLPYEIEVESANAAEISIGMPQL